MNCTLLTGGFGYIGSHTASILAENKGDFLIYDNFSNSKLNIVERLEKTTNQEIKYVEGDIRDTNKLDNVIKKNNISSVIHFAALKSIEESVYDQSCYIIAQEMFYTMKKVREVI